MVFDLSSVCYDVVFFIVLLRPLYLLGIIQIDKTDLISQRYQIIVIRMFKNSSHCVDKGRSTSCLVGHFPTQNFLNFFSHCIEGDSNSSTILCTH